MGWGSVRAKAGVRLGDVGKRFYYEARVDSGGIIQIGWATKRCRLSETEGVGDDRFIPPHQKSNKTNMEFSVLHFFVLYIDISI